MNRPDRVQAILAALILCSWIQTPHQAKADAVRTGYGNFCQILDSRQRPLYFVGIGVVEDSQYAGYGKSSMIEVDGYWDFAYFRNVLRSDLTLSMALDATAFPDSAGLQLPDQVTALYLDVGMTWRYVNGTALRTHLKPGIYSDWEELGSSAFDSPFSVAVIHAFHPSVSGLIGVELRPGFLTKAMPLALVEWDMGRNMRLSAGLPESRFTWNVTRQWSAHWMTHWNNMSYRVRSHSDVDHRQIEIEDFRSGFGVSYRLHDQIQFAATFGKAFERHVEFRNPSGGLDRDIDVEDGIFWQFGVGGPF